MTTQPVDKKPNPATDNLNNDQLQAISVLISAVQWAQSKGCYNLDDAAVIQKAVRFFVPAAPPAATPASEKQEAIA
jgi:hypothetical protein